MGDQIFHYADDPWREAYFKFIAEHGDCTVHHGVTSDAVNVLYCADRDVGMWFLPGSGMGPLPERARVAMKKIIEEHH
jgi:hypothetical protein